MRVHISAKYQHLTMINLGGHVTLATPPFGQILGVVSKLSLETLVPNSLILVPIGSACATSH